MMDDIDNEGIILEEGENLHDNDNEEEVDNDIDGNDAMDEDHDHDDENDNQTDRLAQFHNAVQMAIEADSQGYVTTGTATIDTGNGNTSSAKSNTPDVKTPKELTAISWAAFCTSPSYYFTSSYAAMTSRGSGSGNDYFINIAQDVFKIQALDVTNVLSRMKLALAMLREEEKKLIAKLALKGIMTDDDDDNGDESGNI